MATKSYQLFVLENGASAESENIKSSLKLCSERKSLHICLEVSSQIQPIISLEACQM